MITALLPVWITGQLSDRNPHVYATGLLKTFRHHANHCVALAVEREGLIDDALFTAKASLPQAVTQDHDGITARLVFVIGVEPAHRGIHAQGREKISGHLRSRNAFGFTETGEVIAVPVIDPDFFENVVLIAPVCKVWIRDRNLVH